MKWPSEKQLKYALKKLSKEPASYVLPPDANPIDKAKYEICKKFVSYKLEHNISQKELAEIVGIDPALMSKILHYQIMEFTTDRLVKYLMNLFEDVEIKIHAA